MTYLLITGIVFAVVPAALIQGFAMVILINFARDDGDANSMFRMALGLMGFGIALIIIYFILRAI